MIPEKKDLHALGYFSKLHGYKGELTAALNTDNNRDYVGLENIFVEVAGKLVPYFIETIEYKTNTTMKVKLEGIDSEALAKPLVKCGIYIEPEFVSDADNESLALHALGGFKVIDAEKGEIGVVDHIEESDVNPLMIINSNGKEILLPLNMDFFEEIDQENETVYINAPGGLIDFYLEQ
jgi:16S rRNA processing protein RimM